MAVTAQSAEVLRLADVWKSFDGVDALKGVTFEARAGEIHALLGENGAGKSTLMAIAAGTLALDRGQLELAGEPALGATPAAIRQRGLSIAYQHPALVPDLTVYENVAMWLPRQVREAGKDAASWMRAQLARVGCRANLAQRVSSLSVAQRHLLEIAKAMASDPAVLILDEPTAALGADDTAVLFAELRRLAGGGVAVVYITHRLAEVRELCQQVTVLRDGSVRGTFAVSEITDGELLELIVGRAVTAEFPPKPAKPAGSADEAALTVDGLSARAFHEVTLTAAPGEIIGLAGIVGNGQSEFLRALAGLGRASGRAVLHGAPLKPGRPDVALEAGVVYLSADRLGEGLFGTLSVRENAIVSTLGQFSRRGVTSLRREARAVEAQREKLSIRTPSIEANVLSLSGGNQQKVLLTRALLHENVRLLLAEEPTQGVDVGARAEIYRILRQVADAGAAVVIVSSDIRELDGLCDRVAVFSAGHVVAELRGADVREDAIAHAMMTSTRRREQTSSAERLPGPRGRFAGRAGRAGIWLRDLGRGDFAASAVLGVAIIAIALYTQGHNSRFLSDFNLSSLTVLIAALAFISFGQECVILTGGIDLSVGPLAGLVVVIGSFFENSGRGPAVIVAGFVVMLAASAAVGLFNGAMVWFAKFTPIVATLVTYIALQGISLVLRPFQGGYISFAILNAINKATGPVAIAFLAAAVLAVALEWALHRARWGRSLRAMGSDADAAFRVGVRPRRTVIGAYVASALFACAGGVLLMAQVGVGDPTQGVNYTLASVTAVVLGGTSIFGGRGSFVGALFGAVLVEQLLNVTTFLHLSQAWQYWFEGVLVMVAVGIYTQARSRAGGLAQVTT
jgi:ribose transport system ATP-binding protein